MIDRVAVTALEVLGVLLIAGAAGVGFAELLGLWAGLLCAGLLILGAAARGHMLMEGARGAAVRPSAPRPHG